MKGRKMKGCFWIGMLFLSVATTGCFKKSDGKRDHSVSRIFSERVAGPQYAWDGTASTGLFAMSPGQALAQAEASLKKLGFEIEPSTTPQSGSGAEINAQREQLKARVTVKTAPTGAAGNDHAEVRVQIGTLGERSGGERILDEIARVAPVRSR